MMPFIDRYKVIRRLTLAWAICLITYAVLRTFDHIDKITPAAASALVAVIGILTVVIGFYQYNRHREDAEYNATTREGSDYRAELHNGIDGPEPD